MSKLFHDSACICNLHDLTATYIMVFSFLEDLVAEITEKTTTLRTQYIPVSVVNFMIYPKLSVIVQSFMTLRSLEKGNWTFHDFSRFFTTFTMHVKNNFLHMVGPGQT